MADPLCGTFYPSIDQKGRMSFPNKLRDILGPEFFLCAGHDDHYIAVYSPEEFESYREKLLSVTGKAGSNVRRFLLSCSDKQVPDRNRVEKLFIDLNAVFEQPKTTKEEVVRIMKEYLPNFEHIETGKSLDYKM